MKIALEERKILIAQRKLESMRLLEELFNRVKVIVAQEELKKRDRVMKEEKLKRKKEEENQELMKKLKQEQEEELKEKLKTQLTDNTQENLNNDNSDDQIEEFELRKDTLPNSINQSLSPEKINTNTSISQSSHSNTYVMPRSVLLSNVQLQQQLKSQTPKLYDDEEILNDSNSKEKDIKSYINNNKKSHNEDEEDTGEIFDDDDLIRKESHRDDLSSGEISAENSIENIN
jgi:hypothetical protein